jgi:hypothetical protein
LVVLTLTILVRSARFILHDAKLHKFYNLKTNFMGFKKPKVIILFIVSGLFMTSVSLIILDYSVNNPWADEWDTPGNLLIKEISAQTKVEFADFISQHNESRKLFPKIFYYTIYKLNIFDTRSGVVFRLIMGFLTCFLLYLIISCKSLENNALRLLFSSLLIFLPTQAYNHIFGLQFITIIPPFCIILCLFACKISNSNRTNLFILIISCFISTYSFSNGMINWLIVNPFILRLFGLEIFRKSHIYIFNLFFVFSIILYFLNYQSPAHHPSFIDGLTDPLRLVKYASLWLFSPFLIGITEPLFKSITLSFVFLGFLYLIGNKLYEKIKSSEGFSWDIICGVALLLYSLFSCFITSIGRSGFGYQAALGPQYPSFAIWAHLGVLILFFSPNLRFSSQIKFILLGAYSILFLFSLDKGFNDLGSWNLKMLQAKLTVENLNICPKNSLITEFYPGSRTLIKEKSYLFAKSGIIKFSENDWITKIPPKKEIFSGESGWVSVVRSNNGIRLHGWASIPYSKKPADYVLVGIHKKNRFIPLTFILPHVERKDVQSVLGDQDESIYGFDKFIELHPEHIKNKIFLYSINISDLSYYKLSEV